MNFDDALEAINGIDGAGLDLREREPVWPDFPLGEYRRRYARLAALLDRQDLDALVLTQEEPVRYLSGYNSVIWAVGRWLPTVFVAPRDPGQAVMRGGHVVGPYGRHLPQRRRVAGQGGQPPGSDRRPARSPRI